MHQSITIIGNLGKEPEMRYTPQAKAVTAFTVATSKSYTNTAGEKVQETTWFKVSVWERMAEVCKEYLHKGSRVYIEGVLQSDPSTGGPRLWTGKDGTMHALFEITAHKVLFLSSKADNERFGAQGEIAETVTAVEETVGGF